MPETKTEFYDLIKPQIDGSTDTWGERLNEDLDIIDGAIRNCLQAHSHPNFNTPLTANVTSIPLILPAQPDPNTIGHVNGAATQSWVDGRILFYLNKFFVPGTIMMWSGAFGSVPAGWTFCDGTTVGGVLTPDLRGRFVLCANNAAPVINPWAKEGTLTAYPGEHVHAHSLNMYPGPEAGTPAQIKDGGALYSGVSYSLPYIAQMYIMKYAAW